MWAVALLVLWAALAAQCQMSMTSIRLKRKELTLHSSCWWNRDNVSSRKCSRGGTLCGNISWVKIGVFMIHPCYSPTVAISLLLSKSILLSALSLYIATVCSRFSSKPVHHPISPVLSNAWLAKRCICGDFMNKSVAINFDYNQKPMWALNMVSLRSSVITSISEVPSFWRAMINFFGAQHSRGPWSYWPGLTKEKAPAEEWCEMMTSVVQQGIFRRCINSNWFLLLNNLKSSCLTGWNKLEGNSRLCPWVCFYRGRRLERNRWWRKKIAGGSQRPGLGF